MKLRDVLRIIEQDGWKLDRVNGSHRQFTHPAKSGTVTIAGHPSAEVHPKTLGTIMKQAGLKKP
ncbi:MAG: type II toxin-antitoxin system HicA family toxin [Acidobacteria bacterium]|nr:type II toxin-antitoxin system HicA family toxin [Acidobacteriota bacterium]